MFQSSSVSSVSVGRKVRFLCGVFVSTIVLATVASSASAGVDDLKQCSFLRDGIARSDSSLLMTGVTESKCDSYGVAWPDRSTTLIQLKADGSVDESRPDNGVTVLEPDAGEPVDLVDMRGDRTMVVTENRLILINSSGRRVAGFGDLGVRDVTDLGFGGSTPVLAATATGDGGFALSGGSTHTGLRIAKLDFRGDPDPSFGTGGIATPVLGPDRRFQGIGGMTVDSERRLVLGGVGRRSRTVMPVRPFA